MGHGEEGSTNKLLPVDTFLHMVELMPLIAIDLIIEAREGHQILLGYRRNEPAKNTMFVPGGRIFKNEPFAEAVKRIFYQELGIPFEGEETGNGAYRIHGVYDHFYNNCFYEKNPYYTNTHYVVIAVHIMVDPTIELHPDQQHTRFQWMSRSKLLVSDTVHENTKRYFQ